CARRDRRRARARRRVHGLTGRHGQPETDGDRIQHMDRVMPVTVKRGIYLAPFDELVEPNLLVELAQRAEAGGWDGFFLWDHVRYRTPVRAVSDPWIALSAIATATDTLRIGPMVTPLSRRRVQKVARETVTLDHLSRGRLTLGVGLGSSRSGELAP